MTTASRPVGARDWPAAGLIAFRFLFVYLVLFTFPGPFGYLTFEPVWSWSSAYYQGTLALSRWTQIHLMGIASPLPHAFTGSADTTYRFASYLAYISIAAIAAVVWTLIDRRRSNYSRLSDWLSAWTRICLATIIFGYGFAKIIPTQFATPSLQSYAQPLGEFSPMGLLWAFMGSSVPYSAFGGVIEVLGGLLLLFRRTATLGALILLAALTNVAVLNFTYDVPVKTFTLNLLLMCVFIAAPDLRRLVSVLLLNRPTSPRPMAPLFTGRLRYVVATMVALFVAFNIWTNVSGDLSSLYASRNAVATSALYGIYDVEELRRDDAAGLPVASNDGQWRRVIFDANGRVTTRTQSNVVTRYSSKVDPVKHSVTLTDRAVPADTLELGYEQSDREHLVLRGRFGGGPVVLRLRRFDEKQYLLLTRGFNWIQERPFNR